MRYCFSGHESFPCTSMWLKKGYNYLVEHNKFTDLGAVVKLGVGKNMVQSIRFWLRAFDLLNDDEATEIAHYLFDERDGREPYAEDNATLWILRILNHSQCKPIIVTQTICFQEQAVTRWRIYPRRTYGPSWPVHLT